MITDVFIISIWLIGFLAFVYLITLHIALFIHQKWFAYKMVVARTILQYVLGFYKHSIMQKRGSIKIDTKWNKREVDDVWHLEINDYENISLINKLWKNPIFIAKTLICFKQELFISKNGKTRYVYSLPKNKIVEPNIHFFDKNKRLKSFKKLAIDCYKAVNEYWHDIPNQSAFEIEFLAYCVRHKKNYNHEIKKIRFNIFLDFINWLFKEKNIILQHNLKQQKNEKREESGSRIHNNLSRC